MANNITREDLKCLEVFLQGTPENDVPIMTQSSHVARFEEEWSKWVGTRYSVFVNSGSSANLLTVSAIRHLYGKGEIIVPALTWVSDIASVLQAEMTPVFVDIDPKTFAMSEAEVIQKITSKTRAVFLTHILGFNGLTDRLVEICKEKKILLIEDVCESHGATHKGKRLGSIGNVSNFSFYYGHHMSTVEGGVVCTNDEAMYETVRMLRSHGMVREIKSEEGKRRWKAEYPDLNPDFIFAYPAYNFRNTEMQAVLGLNQLKRLDQSNELRRKNFNLFLKNLNPKRFRTDFTVEGSCNYAFTLVLKDKDDGFRDRIEATLRDAKVEFRRGLSGGGNQLRQPYLRRLTGMPKPESVPEVDHVHFYAWYIGNYPSLPESKILGLCELLNSIS